MFQLLAYVILTHSPASTIFSCWHYWSQGCLHSPRVKYSPYSYRWHTSPSCSWAGLMLFILIADTWMILAHPAMLRILWYIKGSLFTGMCTLLTSATCLFFISIDLETLLIIRPPLGIISSLVTHLSHGKAKNKRYSLIQQKIWITYLSCCHSFSFNDY